MAWAWQLVSPEETAQVRRRLQQATPTICHGKDREYVTGCILISSHLHWLAGGVLTLQTPGSSSACVLLMVTPSDGRAAAEHHAQAPRVRRHHARERRAARRAGLTEPRSKTGCRTLREFRCRLQRCRACRKSHLVRHTNPKGLSSYVQ
jgi:hypothetical protein